MNTAPRPITPYSIALLAGSGMMPYKILEEISRTPTQPHLLALKGITDEQTLELAKKIGAKISFYTIMQLGKAIHYCQKNRIAEITLAGKIQHHSIFTLNPWKLDLTTMKLWFSLKNYKTDTILGAIVNLLEKKGIKVASTLKFLQPYVTPEGLLSGISPSRSIAEDIAFGIPIAKEIGRLDIGQTILIKNRAVVAVEGMEGTDLCIRRAGQIAGAGCVMIKVAKPNQDLRFDVPVLGRKTLEELLAIGAAGLAIQANHSLILDPEILLLAKNAHFPIVGFTCPD